MGTNIEGGEILHTYAELKMARTLLVSAMKKREALYTKIQKIDKKINHIIEDYGRTVLPPAMRRKDVAKPTTIRKKKKKKLKGGRRMSTPQFSYHAAICTILRLHNSVSLKYVSAKLETLGWPVRTTRNTKKARREAVSATISAMREKRLVEVEGTIAHGKIQITSYGEEKARTMSDLKKHIEERTPPPQRD